MNKCTDAAGAKGREVPALTSIGKIQNEMACLFKQQHTRFKTTHIRNHTEHQYFSFFSKLLIRHEDVDF